MINPIEIYKVVERAVEQYPLYDYNRDENTGIIGVINKETGKTYCVDLSRATCQDCPDLENRGFGRPCKHLFMALFWLNAVVNERDEGSPI